MFHSIIKMYALSIPTFSGIYGHFVVLLYLNAAESYQPQARSDHSAILIDDQLYIWGGWRPGLPTVHSSAKKQEVFSFVEVFHCQLGV